MDKKFQIIFGPIASPIAQQLKIQNLKIKRETVRSFQKTADAITRLNFYGYISQEGANSARNKLYKKIAKEVSNG